MTHLLLAGVLVAVLMFGGLVHAFIPHTHSGNEAIAETLHSALSHEQKGSIAVALSAGLGAVLLILFTHTGLLVRSRIAQERDATLLILRRGVVPYRKFR